MFRSWCRQLLAPTTPTRRASAPKWARLGCEALEARDVPTFLAPVSYAAGPSPAGTTVADFNGDGRADLAVVNSGAAGSVGILVSGPGGAFLPRADFAAGPYPLSAASGDFNGDGKADLAVAGQGVSILLGNGDGTFQAPVGLTPGLNAHSVKVGDFNGDGRPDVATANLGSVGVMLGSGDGTFAAPQLSPLAGNSVNLVTGDFNRDGKLDLAASDTTSIGTVGVLRGRGDGTFDPAALSYAYSAPVYLASDDFNGDGYDDFVCPNSYAATSVTVLINNHDGTYSPPNTYDLPETGAEVETGDFNGDGNADFAVRGSTSYMVRLGRGDGTFYPNASYATTGGRFQAGAHGDFNGDGAADLAYPGPSGVTVVLNAADDARNLAGAVGFRVAAPASVTGGSALPLTVTALDAAGNPAPGFRGTVYLTSTDAAANSSLSYTFAAADAGVHSFSGSVRLVTGGAQTVTASAPFLAGVNVAVNVAAPAHHFAVSAPAASGAGSSLAVTVSAVDNLGNVAPGYASSVHFTSSDIQAGLPADYTFTAADAGSHTFIVTLKTAGNVALGASEVGGVIAGSANVAVAAGSVAKFALAGNSGAIGVARAVTVAAQDAYGNAATGYAGAVHFTSSDPLAVLPPDATLVGGTATVPVTFMTVGVQSLAATGIADSSLIGTMLSNATPPVAARFAVAGFPALTAGASGSFTVTVRDTVGQVATRYVGTVFFTSSDVQAGLPASYTFTAADAGVHTFSAVLKTAGAQSISARDSAGLVGGQAGIAVSPAAFAGFAASVPNGADSRGHVLLTAGEAVSLTVRAVDAFGNTVAGYRGKVHLSSTDMLAGLPADYSFAASDAGVRTFSVALKTATPNAVVWSLTATDAASGLGATLTNFEVTNARAARFVVSVPSNPAAGTPFTLKLTVLDAYGNTVKNYFGTVHFSGAAGLPADYTFTAADAGVHSFAATLAAGNQTISITDPTDPLLSATLAITVKSAGGGGGGGGSGGSGGGGGKKV